MDVQMSAPKVELKPKTVLFHISHSLFKNKRLKRRLAGGTRKKPAKKRPKNKRKQEANGQPPIYQPQFSETIEISTDEDEKPIKTELETSIVLSSDNEDELATQTRIFPMLTNETTVRTAVGNTVYELSLTQLKENLETIIKDKKIKGAPASKRLSSTVSADVSISLLSDDEEDMDAK